MANDETETAPDAPSEPRTDAQTPADGLQTATAGSKSRIRAPSPPERACYFILGMHRSGTSSVAGALIKLGVAPPAHLLGPHEGNQLGHWESQPLMVFHDELLASAGSRWDDWRKIRSDWYDTPVAAQFKARANQLLDEEFGDAPLFVFKDPRNCRLSRFWLEIFAERGIAPRIVLPVRSPLEVAQSHHARDGFPLRKGLLLWLRHVLDADAASRDLPRVVLEWDGFLKDWQSSVAAMVRVLGAFPANTDLTAADIDNFLRDDLKHQRVPQEELARNELVHVWVEQAYAALRELARNPGSNSALTVLDQIRSQFDEAAALFGGVLADAEASLTEVAQRLREVDQAREVAQAQLADAQAQLADAQVGLAEVEQRLHQADQAREAAQAQLAGAQQERDTEAAEAARLARAYEGAEEARQKNQQALVDADTRHNELWETVHRYEAQIEQITKSRSWRVISRLGKFRVWRH